ncbi:hypothetical protein [Nonomuraea sp. NPDC049158]|uniref:hypothetical protein n=1 Tax=Nonomuraea sp. NPDC049158 TaxID=3155649 RepID=UPI0034108CD1
MIANVEAVAGVRETHRDGGLAGGEQVRLDPEGDTGVVRVGDGRDADLVAGVGEDAGEGSGPQVEALG